MLSVYSVKLNAQGHRIQSPSLPAVRKSAQQHRWNNQTLIEMTVLLSVFVNFSVLENLNLKFTVNQRFDNKFIIKHIVMTIGFKYIVKLKCTRYLTLLISSCCRTNLVSCSYCFSNQKFIEMTIDTMCIVKLNILESHTLIRDVITTVNPYNIRH